MPRYIEPRPRDWMIAMVRIVIYAVATTVAFIVFRPAGFVVGIVGLFVLLWWHRKAVGYRCEHCGETFEISMLTDLASPHGIGRGSDRKTRGWKYLRCPQCGKRSRATALVAADD